MWVFSVISPPPSPTDKNIISPLADAQLSSMVQVSVYYKVIANTCLFNLTSFSKQSASWKVLEICELCALSTDSRKTYSVNNYMHTGSSSYSFDWGGEIIRWGGGETEKTQARLSGNRSLVGSFPFLPPQRIISPPPPVEAVAAATSVHVIIH